MNCRLTLQALTFLVGCAIMTLPLDAGLVGEWKADGNTNDSSGNGLNGVLQNGLSFETGVIGQAFSFDGIDDFIEVSDPTTLLQPPFLSVTMWIKSDPVAGLRLLADSSHGGSGNAKGWALQLNGSDVSFAYGDGISFPEITSTEAVADGEYHHIAATLSATQMRIYVDGDLDQFANISSSLVASPANNGDIRFGRHFSLNRQYQGLMDDVRIYNHALSASEVRGLAAVPEPSSAALLCVGPAVLMRRRKRV